VIDTKIRCGRNHVLVRWEPLECGKHEHRVYTCAARVGRRACGQGKIVPTIDGTCGDKGERP
jgi:hypothetical protein